MGIRTGAQVLEGFRDGRELYMDGERVADVTKDPRLAGGARTMAQLYDMQHEKTAEMTFASPKDGAPVGLSFLQPKTKEELAKRRVMFRHWHDHTVGMFGRAPEIAAKIVDQPPHAIGFGRHDIEKLFARRRIVPCRSAAVAGASSPSRRSAPARVSEPRPVSPRPR